MSAKTTLSCEGCGEVVQVNVDVLNGYPIAPINWIDMTMSIAARVREPTKGDGGVTQAKISGVHICPACAPKIVAVLPHLEQPTKDLLTGKGPKPS